jgi:hypothetical protein
VKNNRNKCKIKVFEKEYNLSEFLNVKKDFKKDREIQIKLNVISYLTDMSKMFQNCNNLLNIENFELLDTSSVNNMNHIFKGCTKLK